ncbi:MAG: NosD domain-containing protein [Promethearchaeota archaeon]
MKKKTHKLNLLIFISVITSATLSMNQVSFINEGPLLTDDLNQEKNYGGKLLKLSAYLDIGPFEINEEGYGNGTWASWAVNQKWCTGEGTKSDPYIIKNLRIDASSSPNGNGILINESKTIYFTIKNCMIYNGQVGIAFISTANGTLLENDCSSHSDIGISLIASDNNTISNNTISDVDGYVGITLGNSNNNTLSNNIISNVSAKAIDIDGSHQNTISDSLIYNNSIGICIEGQSLYNKVLNNLIINNSQLGIEFYCKGISSFISDNKISGSQIGISYTSHEMAYDDGNYITNNEISNCDDAIRMNSYGTGNIITKNIIKNNTNGIIIVSGKLNNFTQNLIANNSDRGVGLKDDASYVNNNYFYKNVFINNGLHGQDNSTHNFWNSTEIGNYWDNHSTTDSDDDGIDDNPYTWISGSISEDSLPIYGSPIHDGTKILINETEVNGHTWTWAATRWWLEGAGTTQDPYILDGLTVDGEGSGSCILIEDLDARVEIRNCKVYNSGSDLFDAGLRMENVNYTLVELNTIYGNGRAGITITDCYNHKITHNHVFNNDLNGIHLYGGGSHKIFFNNASNNTAPGIKLTFTTENDIWKNRADNNGEGFTNSGIYCQQSNLNNITANFASSNFKYGIELEFCNDTDVIGNVLNYNLIGAFFNTSNTINNNFNWNVINRTIVPFVIDDDGGGDFQWNDAYIKLAFCSGSGTVQDPYIIEDIDINANNASDGLYIADSHLKYFIIRDCDFYNSTTDPNSAGLRIVHVSNGTITRNNCSYNNKFGISMGDCHNMTLVDNIITNNKDKGLALDGINQLEIKNNQIYENEGHGITLIGINDTNIIGNQIHHNGNNGFTFQDNLNILVQDNLISENAGGFYMAASDNISIIDNDILYNTASICNILDGINLNFSLNTVLYNGDHMLIQWVNYSYYCNNIITNTGGSAMSIERSKENIITGNTISSNEGDGIRLTWGSIQNEVHQNTINNNDQYGVKLLNSSYNNVSYNTLLNNKFGAIVEENVCHDNILTPNTINDGEEEKDGGKEEEDEVSGEGDWISQYGWIFIIIGAIAGLGGLGAIVVKRKGATSRDTLPSGIKAPIVDDLKKELEERRRQAEDYKARLQQAKDEENLEKIVEFGTQALNFIKATTKIAKKLDVPILKEFDLSLNSLKFEKGSLKSEIKLASASIKTQKKRLKQEQQSLEVEQREIEEKKALEEKQRLEEEEQLKIKSKKQSLTETLIEIRKLLETKSFIEARRKSKEVMAEAKALKTTSTLNKAKELAELADSLELTSKMNKLLELELKRKEVPTIPIIVKELDFTLDEADKYLKLLTESIGCKRSEKDYLKNEAEKTIKKVVKPNLYDLINTLGYTFEKAKKLGKYMLDNSIIPVFPNVPEKNEGMIPTIPSSRKGLNIVRGGDWKIEGNQSVFYYKVKVENTSPLVITNIQVLLTSIPRGLEMKTDRYQIPSLRPKSYESPSFKLIAKESCVGDIIEGLVSYVDPRGKAQTERIKPFEIKYVCNLLTPKRVTVDEYDYNTKRMEKSEVILDCDMKPDDIEAELSKILKNNNFFLLDKTAEPNSSSKRSMKGYAVGKYDHKDVALSASMEKIDEHSTKLVIEAMSERHEKVIDLLRDISLKCDDIKSDTELIKEYSSQIDDIFEKTVDLEAFLKDRLASDWQKLSSAWRDYKAGVIDRKQLVAQGVKVIGKKFILKLVGKFKP